MTSLTLVPTTTLMTMKAHQTCDNCSNNDNKNCNDYDLNDCDKLMGTSTIMYDKGHNDNDNNNGDNDDQQL